MAPLAIDLMAVNDAIVEGTELYNVSIFEPSSTTGVAVNIDDALNAVDTFIQDTIDAAGTSLDKASFSIAGAASVSESGTTDYTITIDATLQSGEDAAVDIVLTNVDTTAGDIAAVNSAVNAAVATYNGSGQPGSVMWDGTTLTFTSDGTGPMGDLVVQIQATADGFLEGPEDYSLSLINPSSSTGAEICVDAAMDSVTTTIVPNATAAVFSIGVDNAGDEGATVQYTVSLSESLGAGDSAAVDLGLTDVDTNSSDYGNFVAAVNAAVAAYAGPGTVTFDGTTLTFTATADGDAMADLVIDLMLTEDAFAEGTETFTVDLSNATGPTGVNVAVDALADSVTTTINDTMGIAGAPDEVVFSITGPATGPEGSSVQYVLELSGALGGGESASVNLNLNDIDTNSADYASFTAAVSAAAATDPNVSFDAATGVLTYTAPADGATMAPLAINLGLNTDATVEGDEDFQIALSLAASTTGAAVSIDPTLDDVVTTITDTTAPLEWAITGPVTADEGGPAQYTITLSGALGAGETASVQIALADLTTNPNDYADLNLAIAAAIAGNPDLTFDAATGTLTFTAPSDGATLPPIVIDLGIVDDAFVEGPEQFSIGLSNAGSTTGADTIVSATDNLVITEINDTDGFGMDPDQAVWTITGDTTVAETGTAQYVVELTGQFGANEVAVVDLSLSNVDTNSSDYQSFIAAVNTAVANYTGDGSVTFDGTTLTFTAAADGDSLSPLVIDLDAVDDLLIEGDEDYTVSISNAGSTTGGEVILDATTSVRTTIIDDDTATFSLTGDLAVAEGADAKYVLALAGSLQAGETATIELNIGNVTAIAPDFANFVTAVNDAVANYTGPGTLAFDGTTLMFTSDGSPMGDLCIEVGAVDDALVEGSEDFQVSIANPGSTTGSGVITGGPTIVTTTITDNDVATWSIIGDPVVGEGDDAKYTVNLNGTLQAGETATIELNIGNVTAIAPDYGDFVTAVNTAISNYTGPGTLAFDGTTLTFTSDGSPMGDLCIEVGAVDDALIEGNEDFQVSIANPGSTTGIEVVTGGPTIVITTIADNDVATWSIIGDPVVGEGDTAKYTVNLAGTLQAGETATIELNIGNVTAIAPDYANFVTAVNAAIANYAGPGTLAFDGTTLTFTSDGSPMGDLCIEVEAIDDALVEGSEDFQVSIANPGSTTGIDVVTGGPTIVITTITDNDVATWSIIGDPVVIEGDDAKYTVNLNGTLQAGETATIELNIGNVTAIAPDYGDFVTAVNTAISNYTGPGALAFDGTTLTFTSDGNPMGDLCIEVSAVDDGVAEGNEDFQVSIANPGSTTGIVAVTGGPTIVITTITDNDVATWSITGDPVVNEGDDAKYTVNLAGTLQAGETATIDLSIRNTDTTSADYASFAAAVNAAIATYTGPGTLAFDGTTLTFTSDGSPMGDLCIELTATDDALVEGAEDYSILIANATSGTGSTIATSGPTTVVTTITDDDAVVWSIVGDTAVDEGGTAQYTIALDGILQTGETARVQLDLADIESNAADYEAFIDRVQALVAARPDLTFDPATGLLTATGTGIATTDLIVDLDAIDDAFVEGPERYQVLLSNPSSTTGAASSIDPANSSVTTTINDTIGDGGVLESAVWALGVDQTVPEGTPGAYTLTLSGNLQSGEIVTVDLGISDIDTISTDYADFDSAISAAVSAYSGPGTLAWDGATLTFTSDGTGAMDPLAITLDTIDDSFAEGTEDFLIALSNANSLTGAATSIDAASDNAITTIDDTVGDGADAVTFAIVGDTTVDEGGTASYTITTTGGLAAGQDAAVNLLISDIDTNSADYASFNTAVDAAVAAYNLGPNPGTVAWDGTTLVYTATNDGDTLTGLFIDLSAIDDAFLEGPELYNVSLSAASSVAGVVVGIDPIQNIVVTTINDTDGDGGPLEPGGVWSLVGGGLVDEGSSAAFSIGLTGNLQAGESASVQLTLSDLETNSSDYALLSTSVADAVAAYNADANNSGSLTWDGLSLTFTSDGSGPMNALQITLDTINDATTEGPERFNLLLSNSNSTTGLSPTISSTDNLATTTIIDNNGVTWSIVGDTQVDEGSSAQYTVALAGILQSGETASVDLGLADVGTTSADYAAFVAAINTAIAGRTDLAFDGTTLTFTGDGLAMDDLVINLIAVDDALIEGDEAYTVSISNPASTTDSNVAVGGTTSVTTTITDNDTAIWSITGDPTVEEGADAKYVVNLAGTLQAGETATIELHIGNVTAIAPDYASLVTAVDDAVANYSGPGTLAFDGTTLTFTSDGSPMGDLCIEVGAIDDALIEGSEDFTVSIANPGTTTGSGVVTGGPTVVTTTITDNDVATWSITGDPVVGEGADAKYTVNLAGTLQTGETATIELNIGNVTAIAPDYANFVAAVDAAIANYTGPGTLAFDGTTLTFTSDGSPMGDLCIEVGAIDDALVEGSEDFQVSIANPGSTTGSEVVTGGPTIVTTTITDNDVATWSITGDPVVSEGADAKYTVNLAGTLQTGETATIELNIGNVTAIAPDYADFIAAVDDAIANYTGPGTLAFDGTTLTFTSDGSPMGDLCIEVGAIDDALVEGNEDFQVSIANPGTTTGSAVVTGGPTIVTTTITDNDVATWNITGDPVVGEGTDAKYTVNLAGTLQAGETATIELNIGNVTAIAPDYADFVEAVDAAIANYTGPGTLAFDGTTLTFTSDGSPMGDLCIEVGAIDDALVEGNEDFQVSIANPGTTTGSAVVTGGPTIVTTTITDNDVATWNITGDPVVGEGADAKYTVNLAGMLQAGETATIELNIGNVTAIAPDYANFVAAVDAAIANYTGPGTLAFDGTTLTFTSDGSSMGDLCIEVGAVDDALIEGDEDFQVSIANPGSTTGSDVFTGGPTIVTTTITDNDVATWSITGDPTVVEGADAKYTVNLAGTLQAGETATIELHIGNVTAIAADYGNFFAAVNAAVANYTGPGTLAFDGTTLTFTSDGSAMGDLCIEVAAVDDALVEGDEDFNVSIANPSTTTGIDVVTGGPTVVTTTITDNDKISWSIAGDASVDEGGVALYQITLDGVLQTGEDSIVELTLANLETNLADYQNFANAVQTAVASRSDLTFDAATGMLTATGTGSPTADLVIEIDAVDDSLIEGDERYQILLSNPTSTTGLVSCIDPVNGIATTTINDTIGDGGAIEQAVWSIGVDQTVPEGTPGAYTLNLSGDLQSGEIVTVDLAISDLETVGTDYADFDAAIDAAVAAYAGPGTVAWDGTTFTFTSDGTGPMATLPISLGTTNDAIAEGAEDFLIALSNSNSLTGAANSIDVAADDVVTTIDDTIGDGADSVTFAIVGNTTVDEGGTATYVVSTSASLGAGENASVDLSIGDVDTNNADYAGFNAAVVAAVADYNSGSNPGSVSWNGTALTFTAANDGDTLTGLVIDLTAVDDAFLEGPEVYNLTLANSASTTGIVAGIDPALNTVFTTIADTVGDGGAPEPGGQWALTGGNTVNEGGQVTYNIELSGNLQFGETATVQLSLGDIETTSSDYLSFFDTVSTAVADYNADPTNRGMLAWDGTFLSFTSDGNGPMSGLEIGLTAVDDVLVEGDERFNVSLSNPSSSTGLSPSISQTSNLVTTTIVDNDAAVWSITGPSETSEGSDALYTVSLDGTFQAGEIVSVQIDLSDIDTDSGDYGDLIAAINAAVAGNPDVTFDSTTGVIKYTAPSDGAMMADIEIALPIVFDGVSEPPENYAIALSNPASTTGLSSEIDPTLTSVTTTINGSPVLQPDFEFTSIDTPFVGNLLSNDSDPDGDVLMVIEVNGVPIGGPIETDCGTVVVNPNGTYVFTPNPGFFGVDNFTYTVVDSAGNTETTTVEITVNAAELGIAKAASDAVPNAVNGDNFDITFTLALENLGNVPLNNLTLSDDLMAMFGGAFVSSSTPVIANFSGPGTAPTINALWVNDTSQNILAGGSLEVGASFDVVFTVTLDPDSGSVAQGLSNQASGSGQGVNPDGSPMLDSNGDPAIASDVSDDGSDPAGENGSDNGDGVFGNDSTPIVIADLGIAKSIVGEPVLLFNGNYVVTYQVVVQNTGTVGLTNVSLLEDLTTQFGSALVNAGNLTLVAGPANSASTIAVNAAGFNGSTNIELIDTANANTLVVGDSFALQFEVEIDPIAANGEVENQISGSGAAVDANGQQLVDASGNLIVATDLSDSGADPTSTNPDDASDSRVKLRSFASQSSAIASRRNFRNGVHR